MTKEEFLNISKDEQLKSVKFFINANNNEQHNLWREWYHIPKKLKTLDPSDKPYLLWEEIGIGFSQVIGYIKNDTDMPVNLSFSFCIINGNLVCFYDSISRYVDHEMIDEWLNNNYPIKYSNNQRRAHTNATNFSNCIWYCRENF